MSTTKVINLNDAPNDWKKDPRFVYIGRQMRFPVSLGRSVWANPFKFQPTGDANFDLVQRQLVLGRYCHWLLTERPDLVERARVELRGKILVCWCSPEICHGDVLAQLANAATPAVEPAESPNQMRLFEAG